MQIQENATSTEFIGIILSIASLVQVEENLCSLLLGAGVLHQYSPRELNFVATAPILALAPI